jgi:hypothetical protein
VPNCPHGFPEGECLICRTLGTGPEKGKATKTKGAGPPEAATLLTPLRGGPMVAAREQGPGPERHGHGKRGLFWPILGVIVVGAVVVWLAAGVFATALHIVTYVAVALVAGWAGYRLGHARGRRRP